LTGLKKNLKNYSVLVRKLLVDPQNKDISISRQCELLGISRFSYYYSPKGESVENLIIMDKIDEIYLDAPFYGVKRMKEELESSLKIRVNHKRVRRLMQLMNLKVIYQKPRTSKPGKGHKIHPYLLRGLMISMPDQVWCSDITYIGLQRGFMYLTAIMDWYSRYVVAWGLSNSLETSEVVETLHSSLQLGTPEIFNTDQGSQFTSNEFTSCLKSKGIRISMDGRGRAYDNIFIERLWRTVKYEHVYLNEFENGHELFKSLDRYFKFYNNRRKHSSLGYLTPLEVYHSRKVIHE